MNAAQLEKLKYDLSRIRDSLTRIHLTRVTQIIGVLFLAYLTAASVSAIVLSTFLTAIATKNPEPLDQKVSLFSPPVQPNYRDLKKAIIDRNIFNSEGIYPDETEDAALGKGGTGNGGKFNADGPCSKTSLNLTLLGTIAMGGPKFSLATLKETSYEEADIYRIGDKIVGHDQASIYAIERNQVIINNAGNKECLELDSRPPPNLNGPDAALDSAPPTNISSGSVPVETSGETKGDSSSINLEGAWVEAQLGPGFGKIINDARLVPHMVNNKVQGFKIFAIKPDSLFGRIGLSNGDVVLQVGDVSLGQAEQGFAIYQAFQDQREFYISAERNGRPVSIQVKIK